MFKVNNRDLRTRSEISSKLTIKYPERCHWRCSGVFIVNLTIKTPERCQSRRSCVFIVNFEHISHLFVVFSNVDFEQVNVSWVKITIL